MSTDKTPDNDATKTPGNDATKVPGDAAALKVKVSAKAGKKLVNNTAKNGHIAELHRKNHENTP